MERGGTHIKNAKIDKNTRPHNMHSSKADSGLAYIPKFERFWEVNFKSTLLWYTPRRDHGSQNEESLSEGPTGERVQEGNKILIGGLYSAQASYQPSCPDQFVRPILQDTTICLFWT